MLHDVLWSILGLESEGFSSGIVVACSLTITLRFTFFFLLLVSVSELHANTLIPVLFITL